MSEKKETAFPRIRLKQRKKETRRKTGLCLLIVLLLLILSIAVLYHNADKAQRAYEQAIIKEERRDLE